MEAQTLYRFQALEASSKKRLLAINEDIRQVPKNNNELLLNLKEKRKEANRILNLSTLHMKNKNDLLDEELVFILCSLEDRFKHF